MQSNSSKLMESTTITFVSYITHNFEERQVVAGKLWRTRQIMAGKLRRTRYIMAGKETGTDTTHCGGKTTFAHKPLNTSNWIKIMDCKWKHVHLGYKLHNTQTSEIIALPLWVSQLTSHLLKPGNSGSKLSHCKSRIKSGLTNSYDKAFQSLFVKR